ncbi:MAG: hypothetical protein ACI89D_001909 [Bermanella sp.]|jgi:hypothetical protein
MKLGSIQLEHGEGRVALSEIWRDGPVLLVLLRHSGCPICREHLVVTEEILNDIAATGCRVIGVCHGRGADAESLGNELELHFPVYADPDLALYKALAMPRGSWWQVTFRPMLREPVAAMRRMRKVRKPGKDVRQLGGVVLLDEKGDVSFRYCQTDSADMPADDIVLAAVAALAS